MLEPIYEYKGGEPILLIDLSSNIPLLKEYLKVYDESIERMLASGELNRDFNFTFEQFKYLRKLKPHWNYQTEPGLTEDEIRSLSTFWYIPKKKSLSTYKK